MRRVLQGMLLLLALVAAAPLIFLVAGSLMGQTELNQWLLPIMKEGSSEYVKWRMMARYPTLWSYVKLLLDSPAFFVMFWNSVKLTFGVLAGQILVGVPAAWAFAKYQFRGKKFLFTLYIAMMMMPFQVLMLSNYLVLDRLKLLDSLAGILLPGVFSTFPVFLMYRFFCAVPDALLDAARLDGAGEIQIFLRLAFPLGSPGIISAMVLGFLEYWNLIEQPLAFLKDKSLWPMSLFLPNITLEEAGLAFATSVVALLPALFVFLAGQDYLEQGIVAAAVKE
ncbi:MAG: carbohydrate ABC transporter permease [Blautia sp.]|jgi:multiple sugar transport system permease protein